MENRYRCDVCKDSGAVKTGEFEYSNCPCVSDERHLETSEVKQIISNDANNLRLQIEKLIVIYLNKEKELDNKFKPYLKLEQYAKAKELGYNELNIIRRFITNLKSIK